MKIYGHNIPQKSIFIKQEIFNYKERTSEQYYVHVCPLSGPYEVFVSGWIIVKKKSYPTITKTITHRIKITRLIT